MIGDFAVTADYALGGVGSGDLDASDSYRTLATVVTFRQGWLEHNDHGLKILDERLNASSGIG